MEPEHQTIDPKMNRGLEGHGQARPQQHGNTYAQPTRAHSNDNDRSYPLNNTSQLMSQAAISESVQLLQGRGKSTNPHTSVVTTQSLLEKQFGNSGKFH